MKLLIQQQTITCVPLIPETFCTFMKTQSGPLALGNTMTRDARMMQVLLLPPSKPFST
jgi:hypothetical protein